MTDRETEPDGEQDEPPAPDGRNEPPAPDGRNEPPAPDGRNEPPVPEGWVGLYDAVTGESGISRSYPHLEPDPETWTQILKSRQFRGALDDLDDLLERYERPVVAHVAPETFRKVHLETQSRPDELWLFLADDYDEFTRDVTHPFFGRIDEARWTQPFESPLVLRFDIGYRHTLDIPEGFSHLDVKIPTMAAYRQRLIQLSLEDYF